MKIDNKLHWESVYENKNADQVSWTQNKPTTSLDLIKSCDLGKDSSIIDIGGGDSRLVDYLLEEGYQNLTVLDISEKALHKAKLRLGDSAKKVNWIVSDINTFKPETTYDIWHDRAVFHFLTSDDQIKKYTETAMKSVNKNLIIGTFSETGPDSCSGLAIKKYDEARLTTTFIDGFKKLNCLTEDHFTPFDTIQNFQFCIFQRSTTDI